MCNFLLSVDKIDINNNANIIALGARLTKVNVALKCVQTFLKTNFKGGRHLRRVKKI